MSLFVMIMCIRFDILVQRMPYEIILPTHITQMILLKDVFVSGYSLCVAYYGY